jgi:putative ABC transport system permease protein
MTLREGLSRVAAVFGRGRRRERDLQEELAFHREMLEAGHRARGLDPDAARRAAAVALGGPAQITEAWRDQRGLPFLDMLLQDVRYGLRVLRRTPGFTLAALLTLAIGIGANTAIFTVVNAVLLRPLPYADPDRLVTIGDRNAEGFSTNIGFATLADFRERSRSFDHLALMRGWAPTLFVNGEAEALPAVRVSWNYFQMMGVRPALGRDFMPDDDRPEQWRVLLLSDGLWRRRFGGDPSIVGRAITMNDRAYRVIGVVPASFEPLDAMRYFGTKPEMWAPLGYDRAGDSSCYSCRHLRGFGRLKPGATIEQATAELDTIREQIRREHPTEIDAATVAVVPLRRAVTGAVQRPITVLMAAVAFVLLIACANVGNLLVARSVTRRGELALRAALGAGRRRLARQLLTESVLLSAGGAVLGVLFAIVAVRGLAALAPVDLPRLEHIGVDGPVLLFTTVVALVAGLGFGVLPAWRSGAADARQSLSVDARSNVGGGHSRARALLVVVDLALAMVLLAGAGLMLRTVVAMASANPGFATDGILTAQFSLVGQAYAEDSAVRTFQAHLLDKLQAIPGVDAAALADQVPFGGNYDCRGFHVRGRMKANPEDDPCIERYGVTPGYRRLMNIPLVAGRDLLPSDSATSQPVVLISQATAREVFGADNPIGAEVRLGSAERGPWRTIVGIVGDVHHADVTVPVTHAMYVPEEQLTDSFLVAIVKTSIADVSRLAAPVRDAIRQLDPKVPVTKVAAMPDLVREAAAGQLFVTRLLAGFAAIAVLLATIGLYGVLSYGVTQRTREVGVRVALGARRVDVLRLVLSGGTRLVAIGVAAGAVGAALSTRLLDTLVFGVSPLDPLTYAGAAAVLIAVALLAHWVPVRRALRIDPALALRAE